MSSISKTHTFVIKITISSLPTSRTERDRSPSLHLGDTRFRSDASSTLSHLQSLTLGRKVESGVALFPALPRIDHRLDRTLLHRKRKSQEYGARGEGRQRLHALVVRERRAERDTQREIEGEREKESERQTDRQTDTHKHISNLFPVQTCFPL